MKGVVIVHPEAGIYLGHCLGLGFFSQLDCAGQDHATVISDIDLAREHIATWESNNDPSEYRFVEVDAAADWATIEELEAVGLSEFTKTMRAERLSNLGVAGSA
ncbi:hypothetical protein V6R98_02195 [Agrobacterium sp. CCNWLW71]|uniref:hypothetical protein n=1 Tax=unclassified Agrobacterium TaxID=2632611 RepID=UPI002FF0E347